MIKTLAFNMFMAKSWFSSKKQFVNYQIGLDIIYETASGKELQITLNIKQTILSFQMLKLILKI